MVAVSATLILFALVGLCLWVRLRRQRIETFSVGAHASFMYAPGDRINFDGIKYKVVEMIPGQMKVRRIRKRSTRDPQTA